PRPPVRARRAAGAPPPAEARAGARSGGALPLSSSFAHAHGLVHARELGEAARVEHEERATVAEDGHAGETADATERREERPQHRFLLADEAVDGERIEDAVELHDHEG